MGYIDHRRLIHSEAKKIGENHFALCSGHHVLIAPLVPCQPLALRA
jgi:hypothetical protein